MCTVQSRAIIVQTRAQCGCTVEVMSAGPVDRG